MSLDSKEIENLKGVPANLEKIKEASAKVTTTVDVIEGFKELLLQKAEKYDIKVELSEEKTRQQLDEEVQTLIAEAGSPVEEATVRSAYQAMQPSETFEIGETKENNKVMRLIIINGENGTFYVNWALAMDEEKLKQESKRGAGKFLKAFGIVAVGVWALTPGGIITTLIGLAIGGASWLEGREKIKEADRAVFGQELTLIEEVYNETLKKYEETDKQEDEQ